MGEVQPTTFSSRCSTVSVAHAGAIVAAIMESAITESKIGEESRNIHTLGALRDDKVEDGAKTQQSEACVSYDDDFEDDGKHQPSETCVSYGDDFEDDGKRQPSETCLSYGDDFEDHSKIAQSEACVSYGDDFVDDAQSKHGEPCACDDEEFEDDFEEDGDDCEGQEDVASPLRSTAVIQDSLCGESASADREGQSSPLCLAGTSPFFPLGLPVDRAPVVDAPVLLGRLATNERQGKGGSKDVSDKADHTLQTLSPSSLCQSSFLRDDFGQFNEGAAVVEGEDKGKM